MCGGAGTAPPVDCRCSAANFAGGMRPHLVVVGSPGRDLDACLLQVLEPVLVQALVAKLAVEALHVGVLRGLARLVEDVAHALGLCPGPWRLGW